MIDPDVVLGHNVTIFDARLVNIFGCEIGDDCFIGPFVEITRGVKIGRHCKIESHSFICDGVSIGDHVFIAHGVMFTNDLYPTLHRRVDRVTTIVDDWASLGSNATVIGGVRIGRSAIVGAGAVVTKDVPDFVVAAGNPAQVLRTFKGEDDLRAFIEERQRTAHCVVEPGQRFGSTGRKAP